MPLDHDHALEYLTAATDVLRDRTANSHPFLDQIIQLLAAALLNWLVTLLAPEPPPPHAPDADQRAA